MLTLYLSLIDDDAEKSKFETLYHTYKNTMLYTAIDVLGDKHLAEDAVQEAFIILAKKISIIRTDNPRETKAFIVSITKNCAFKIANKNSKYVIFPDEDLSENETIPDPVDYEEMMISLTMYDEISKFLKTLDAKYIIPFQLQELGYTIKEIADLLDLSESAVKMRILRIKRAIVEKLEGANE